MTIFAEWSRPPIGELGALRGGSLLGCLKGCLQADELKCCQSASGRAQLQFVDDGNRSAGRRSFRRAALTAHQEAQDPFKIVRYADPGDRKSSTT
jgi:hypothetical protein